MNAPSAADLRTWRRQWLGWAVPALIAALLIAWLVWSKTSLPDDAKHVSVYPHHPNLSRLVFVFGWMAMYFAAYGLVSVVKGKVSKAEALFYLVFWSAGPPVYFFIEWFLIFPTYGESYTIEAFKSGQEITRNMWAGIVAAFAVLQFVLKEDGKKA